MRDRAQAARTRGIALRGNLEAQRGQHDSVETAFCWIQRDKDIAGGVLGGGLAYRFFFWVLALTVLLAGGLGIASASGADVAGDSREAGVTDALAAIIANAAEQSESARWWLVLTGLVLYLWFSYGLLRALHLVHAAAWRVPPPRLRNLPRAIGFVVAAPIVLLAVAGVASWIRAHTANPVGLVATLAVAVAFGAVWLWVSMYLPSQDVPWTAFVPGAIVFGLGLEVLHVFTAYFLAAKLASASELYGVLGLATTALFYFFLVGRGVVWAAELNATVWEVRARRK
jgi:membrane protein